jgi:hypothetical protein
MDNFTNLEYGQSLKLSKPNGKLIYEFRRCSDPVMDNMMDVWNYDPKKSSKKGTPSWILLKDLEKMVNSCISSGYTEVKWETY